MQRRTVCKLMATLPWFGASLLSRHAVAQVPAKPVPVISPLRTIEIQPELETAEPPVLTAVAVSPNGQVIAAAGDDHNVRIWNAADGTLTAELHEHTDWIRSVSFSPSGKQLLTAGDDRLLKLWDLSSGTVTRTIENATGVLHRSLFLPDGKQFVSSGFDNKVRLYDVATGASVHEFECTGDDVRALAVSPTGRHLAAAGRDGVLRIWNLADKKQIAEAPAHRMRIRVLAYSPDGEQFVTAGDDRKFFLWKADGTRDATLAPPPGRLMSAVFLGNDRLAVGGSDNLIRILDPVTRQELQHAAGHTGSVAALDYFADTGLLVSSSYDTTVRLWKPEGGKSPNQVTQRPATTAAPLKK